ncbi:hypothetical protein Acid345_2472 [Candidatus Koribacter versatilis Ellin345]|uniref:DUF4398 domain-containing protein n=1 Tax=Koribacter versatilis (strain Ellin345) TaxID=204669 RepID=Q1INS7_KORVE|nr:hypothetical protein [Candidatus Koribacter versatilis]ABF41473.1 hypothetical protein Acid345_2472 [Candidatus Koribacter versatilis Ellin345]
MKKNLQIGVVGIALFLAGTAVGQKVSANRHPNLAAAQNHVEMARQKLSAAQQANEFDMGGHAAKAKQLLDEAYGEIKEAAVTANHK